MGRAAQGRAGQGRAGQGGANAGVGRLQRTILFFLLSVAPQKGTFGANKKRSRNSGLFRMLVAPLLMMALQLWL